MKNKNYIIWGSKGHAKVLADSIKLSGGFISALIDNDPKAISVIDGIPILYGKKEFNKWIKLNDVTLFNGMVAIGGNKGQERIEIQNYLFSKGVIIDSYIDSKASVATSCIIGEGTQILTQAMVGSGAIIGKACIINNRSGVDHECIIGDACHIAPGATLCGEVKLENNVFIGAGAVILPRITIGKNSIIGAGSVVTKNIPENKLVYGNPAKIKL